MASLECFSIADVRVDELSPPKALQILLQWKQDSTRAYAVFCTASSVVAATEDSDVKDAINAAGMVCPDGMPLVWLGRRRGLNVERVYGPDFMTYVFETTHGTLNHFFFGGAPGVAEKMAERLRGRFPALSIVGTFSPPMELSATEINGEVVDCLNSSSADVIWVGLGHPKQEIWMNRYRPHLQAPVLAGVGAAFDFHSGRRKEAPDWMKRSGLQWLHRLLDEPGRLWKRYLVGNTKFLWLVAVDRLKRRES